MGTRGTFVDDLNFKDLKRAGKSLSDRFPLGALTPIVLPAVLLAGLVGVIGCGHDSIELGSVSSVSATKGGDADLDQDLAPHLRESFYEQNWPGNPWELLNENEGDYSEWNPSQSPDAAALASPPETMASLGDSMSRAAIAGYQRSDIFMLTTWLRLGIGGVMAWASDTNRGVEDLGHSWTTGTGVDVYRTIHKSRVTKRVVKVKSHAIRLQELNSRLKIYSGAVSGSVAKDVAMDQVHRVMSWARKTNGRRAPDYVTLMIGPNDICADSAAAMTSANEYHDHMVFVMDRLMREDNRTRVLVNSVPNIDRLREIAKNARMSNLSSLTCSDVWNIAKFCPTLTTIDDPRERAKIRDRVTEYNHILEDLVEERRAAFGDRIRYVDMTEIDYNPDDLSIDCFHPNIMGQNKISQASWPSTWWAK